MSYRFMRIIVMFDLPVVTSVERQEYTKFRKFLLKSGFIMMQESVYTKLALNGTVAELIRKKVRKNKPPEGLIEMLIITEKQFSGIEYISGEEQNCVIDGEERLIVI